MEIWSGEYYTELLLTVQRLYKDCTKTVQQIEESPDSESCEAHVPCVHIQSPAAATSRQDMEDMDIWAGRHGQWAEEGEWGGKSQTGSVVEMFGWVGFSCPRADNSVSLH